MSASSAGCASTRRRPGPCGCTSSTAARSSAPPPDPPLVSLRRRPRSAALLRLVYRAGYRAVLAWSRLARPGVRGVKCVLRDEAGRAAFVRHHYGDRRRWEIPGGAAHRGEPLRDAVAREAWEELGADVSAWRELGSARGLWYGKDEVLTVFSAPWPGGPVRPDPVEIAAVGWFALDRPPSPLGPTTVAALEVVRSAGA